MANIKIGDLREVLKNNKKEDIKVVDYRGLSVEIKQHLTIQEKVNLAGTMFESAINNGDGLHILDGNNLDIAYKVFLTQAYTNIPLPQRKNSDGKMEINPVESYDLLVSSGLHDFIYDNIPEGETDRLEDALYNYIDAKKQEYEQINAISDRELRIENVIKDGIDKLLVELAKFIDKLPEKDEWGNIMKDIPQSLDGLFSQIKDGTNKLEENEREYLKQLANTVIGDMANKKVSRI